MREILFRGKRIDNGEWVYGDYWHLPEKNFYCISDKEFNRKVTPETVGQYTGLTDKNGKKIFEGDIVAVPLSGKPAKGIYEVIGNIHDNPELLGTDK